MYISIFPKLLLPLPKQTGFENFQNSSPSTQKAVDVGDKSYVQAKSLSVASLNELHNLAVAAKVRGETGKTNLSLKTRFLGTESMYNTQPKQEPV